MCTPVAVLFGLEGAEAGDGENIGQFEMVWVRNPHVTRASSRGAGGQGVDLSKGAPAVLQGLDTRGESPKGLP